MKRISVVLTLYKTEARILRLLSDLRLTLKDNASISLIMVNDCSPSKKVHLKALELKKSFPDRARYLRNKKNQGYLASVEKGIRNSNPRSDLILLNCDTRVFGNWPSRLQQMAYADSRTASVMPMTNNLLYASIWSPPRRGSKIEKQAAIIDQQFSGHRRKHRMKVPSTFGFCMFIKRTAWNSIGGFDKLLFSPGYGEEVDWCFRAQTLGFNHVLCGGVFVYHYGGASFSKPEARRLLQKSSLILKFKYPDMWDSYCRLLKATAKKPFQTLKGFGRMPSR
ncbi:MAG: glycosyltransferase [Bdellovibrionales bacterium]|nr:glycosyltransferase [Bdellovibrionales bacterium]